MKSRLITSSVIALAGAIVFAGSSLACYKPPVFEPAASVVICGDPRVQSTLDNSASNVPAVYKLKFAAGNDKTRLIVAKKKVAAGDVKVTKFRWAHGSRPFVIKVRTEDGWQTLVRESVRNATPWGQGACPANRFG